jgi:Tfp pilus assembly protein FimT
LYLTLLIMPGTQGTNRFGDPPPPNTTGVILLALVLPLVLVAGILAAIAIPAYQNYAERARGAAQAASAQPR